MLGTNDSKESNWNEDLYTQDLEALTTAYMHLKSTPRVYLMIPPHVEEFNKNVQKFGILIPVVNFQIPKIIRNLARKLQIGVIDMSKAFIDLSDPHREDWEKGGIYYWTGDGVHPNDKTYEKLAYMIAANIDEASGTTA